MTLNVDAAAEATYARIIRGLRTARINAGLSQDELAKGLPFRGRAVSEWETGAVEPKLNNLILVADKLQHCMVLVGPHGRLENVLTRRRPGEERVVFLRRQLATPLRNRRLVRRMSQGELSLVVGVSRDSVQRWELAHVPPRPMAHTVWAQQLGYTLALAPRT